MTTKHLALVAVLATGVVACQETNSHSSENKLKSSDTINATVTSVEDITVVPFQNEGGGWGFDIKVGPKVRIHQELIPVILGRKPFATKEDALKVGENLAQKMRTEHNGFPDLTRKELLDMHIAGVE